MFRHLAYLDPGTGSMAIQAAIGVVAGISIFARRAIISAVSKVGKLFMIKKRVARPEESE
jgi:hypothetical protein